MKKLTLIAFALSVLGILMAGCSQGSTTGETGGTAGTTGTEAPKEGETK